MHISDEDYDKYIKPILDNEDLWLEEDAFYDAVMIDLVSKMYDDHRLDDFHDILMELVVKRKQLLDKLPPLKGYEIEIDDNGNPVGEPRPIEFRRY